MTVDVVDLKTFYSLALGRTAQLLVADVLKGRWPQARGERVLGLGYAVPYLDAWREEAERTVAFMPAVQGVHHWPSPGPSATALVEDLDLPLADASIDRVLVVHGLEMTDSAQGFLREVWRVLSPGGRILLVVPNRRGAWARVDRTPFGYGRPYSRAQLVQLLRETLFQPVGWSEALHLPPLSSRLVLRWAGAWERTGRTLWPAFAGVIVVEATKQLYAPLAKRKRSRFARELKPSLLPGRAAGAGISRISSFPRATAGTPPARPRG